MSRHSQIIWITALLLCAIAACEGPAPQWRGNPEMSYRDFMHIKGPAIHLTVETWWPEDSQATVATTLLDTADAVEEWRFAPTGQALEWKSWKHGALEYQGTNVFNDSMQLLEHKPYSGDGKRSGYMAYEYNPDGTPQSSQRFDGKGRLTRHVRWEYDQRGRKTAEFGITYNKKLDESIIQIERDYRYHYEDTTSNYTIATEYEDGKLVRTTKFQSGIEVSHYNEKDKGWGKNTFDAAGRLVASEEWDEGGTLWNATYNQYDSLGRLVSQRLIQSSLLRLVKQMRYDDQGMLIEERRAMPQLAGTPFTGSDTLDPIVETYRYVTDPEDNWIRKETYYKGMLSKLETRKIDYAR